MCCDKNIDICLARQRIGVRAAAKYGSGGDLSNVSAVSWSPAQCGPTDFWSTSLLDIHPSNSAKSAV